MLTEESNIGKGHRVAPKYSDSEILMNLFSGGEWAKVFGQGGLFILIGRIARFLSYALAFSLGTVFRCRYGVRTVGFILLLLGTLALMVSFNSTRIWIGFKPFFGFVLPVLPFVMEPESLWSLMIKEVHSIALLYFSMGVAALGLFNVLAIKIGFGNDKDATKRGDSYLYRLFFKRRARVSETLIQGLIEPLIASSVGLLFAYEFGDLVFAIYLWLSSACLSVQEVFDVALQRRIRHPG